MIINRSFKEFKFRHRNKQNQIIYTSKRIKGEDEILNLIDNFLSFYYIFAEYMEIGICYH